MTSSLYQKPRSMIPNIKLHNGVEIPLIGQGTYPMAGNTLYNALKNALDCGCTLFDTAHSYPNEASIGEQFSKIFAAGKYKRNDVFIISKIGDRLDHGMPMGYYFYNSDSCPDKNHRRTVFRQVEDSLRNLRTDYVDLLLLHWPYTDCLEEIWQAMESIYKKGMARAIGVSNHRPRHIRRIMDVAEVTPMVNQIYFSPLNTQADTTGFCNEHDILCQAYSPLMFLRSESGIRSSDEIKSLCAKYNKSLNQIILRWDIQNGIVPIPKAASLKHIEENYDIFDFSLEEDEMNLISSFNVNFQYLPESVYCPGY